MKNINGIIMTNAERDMVVLSIERGIWEDVSRMIWVSLVGSLPPNSVIWDVGAYTGYYALLAAQHSTEMEIYAFEPNPSVYQTLVENMHANSAKLTTVSVALSDANEEIELNITNDIPMPSGSSIVEVGLPIKRQIKIQTVTGDFFTSSTYALPNLIKIDVEGAELKVLNGMVNVLKYARPIMLIELLTDDVAATVIDFLKPYNYRHYHINESMLSDTPNPSYRNFLFYPN